MSLPINQVLCGDCLETVKKFPPKSIDCIMTDPPYSTPVITAYGRQKEKNFGDLSVQYHFIASLKLQFERLLRDKAPVFMFCDASYYPILFQVFYDWQTTHLLVWDKQRIGFGKPFRHQYELVYFLSPNDGLSFNKGMHYSDVLKCKPVAVEDRLLGSQKPIVLLRRFIKAFTKKGDVVLDPFVGSGTTCVAASQLERKYIGIDINPDYVEMAKERLRKECSQKLSKWT